ncbi:hypothetical protein BS50DRAFT_558582, partial [Corynespora cassiicola Philippines]
MAENLGNITSSTASSLRSQWANPGDILSLLLLIGGDVVQRAIAQLIGCRVSLPQTRLKLSIAPVAFSFGWVAYGFSNLLSAMGDKRLMPSSEFSSVVVNCSNGFARETQSWVLSRLLRDHETRLPIDPRPVEGDGRAESLRIDVFTLQPVAKPSNDFVWWFGWFVIAAQIGIAISAWVAYGDWGAFAVSICGNLLVAITCSLPQWTQEKWAGRKLNKSNVTCLTRGNGSLHIMVFIGTRGSWDMESLARGASTPRPETRWVSLGLAFLWIGLLISVSGLKENAWFLVAIGGIGMLQNAFAAGTSRRPNASGFHFTPFPRAPTIIGKREKYVDDEDANVDLDNDLKELSDLNAWALNRKRKRLAEPVSEIDMPRWLDSMSKHDGIPEWLEPVGSGKVNASSKSTKTQPFDSTKNPQSGVIYATGVNGALMELEKWVPTAGLAMVQLFFPSSLSYNDQSIRDNIHKKFWKRAYCTKDIRKRAEEERREEVRNIELEDDDRREAEHI